MSEELARQEIRGALTRANLVPVLGAGFSAAVAALPGWAALIESGLAYVEGLGTASDDALRDARHAFDPATPEGLIAGARALKALLGAPAGQFPGWLKHSLEVDETRCSLALVNAVADLLAPIVATTNYDKLLSSFFPFAEPLTWHDSAGMADLLHAKRRVLHVHGVWDRPNTVVFGADDYDRLVTAPAYEAVLRTLWLDRTLLFIGCSFDGLQDPDFLRFVEWTTSTFSGLTHNHYALVRAGDLGANERRKLLHESRIWVVEYPEHDLLPDWLRSVNPNAIEARRLREALCRQLVDDQDVAKFAKVVSGLPGEKRDLGAYIATAQPLFEEHGRTLASRRRKLAALQQLVRQFVDDQQLRRAAQSWTAGTVAEDWDPFYATAIAAGDALFLIEDDFLKRLWRLEAGIHAYAATGHLRSELAIAQAWPMEARRDEYSHENLARILRTVIAFLDLKPDLAFPTPQRGRVVEAGVEAWVLIRADGLELRDREDFAKVVGRLPEAPPGLDRVRAVELRGDPALVGHGGERICAWNPRASDIPFATFRHDELDSELQDLHGIFAVGHRETAEGLLSAVVVGTRVHWLRDLRPCGPPIDLRERTVREITWIAGDSWFGVGGDQDRILAFDPRGVRELLSAEELRERWSATLVPPLAGDADLDNFRLHRVARRGKPLLAVRARIANAEGSIVALLDTSTDAWTIAGGWHLADGVCVDVATVVAGDDVIFLLACMLRSSDPPRPIVRRARGVQTTRGLLFAEEGALGTAASDTWQIQPVSKDVGVVVDTAERVWRYDLERGSFDLLGAVRGIRGLCLFPGTPRAGTS